MKVIQHIPQKCDKFIFRKEVQVLRAVDHLSFKNIRQVNSRCIRPGIALLPVIVKITITKVKTPPVTDNIPLSCRKKYDFDVPYNTVFLSYKEFPSYIFVHNYPG